MKRREFITLLGSAAAACRAIQRSGITAGHQRRKRGAVDCTAAQAVAAALLASGWAIPSRRADQGRDCGAAENQRIAENAPRWPGMNTHAVLAGACSLVPIRPIE